jgi:hypothetical protein
MEQDRRLDDLHTDVREIRNLVIELGKETTANSVVLSKNTEDVAEHIRRTSILEDQVQEIRWSFKVLLLVASGLSAAAAAIAGLFGFWDTLRKLF